MTLHLTPDILRAAYNYLNETPPFSKWNLPDGEDVIFHVMRKPDERGNYWNEDGKHHIALSSACIGRTTSLMETMGHEMIHLHEASTKSCTRGMHSKAFKQWAAQVCRVHNDFDPKLAF